MTTNPIEAQSRRRWAQNRARWGAFKEATMLETFNRHHRMAMFIWTKDHRKAWALEWAALHWREIVRHCGPLD